MGGIAIPVVPIREDINLEIDEESNHHENANEMNNIAPEKMNIKAKGSRRPK